MSTCTHEQTSELTCERCEGLHCQPICQLEEKDYYLLQYSMGFGTLTSLSGAPGQLAKKDYYPYQHLKGFSMLTRLLTTW